MQAKDIKFLGFLGKHHIFKDKIFSDSNANRTK
jgi:hypothetical protein